MMYSKSKIKIDTKNHRKNYFNLTTGQFLFSKYKIIKGPYVLNGMYWVFDQRRLIFKSTFQNWHLSYLISTIRLWIYMIFEKCELIPEQEILSNKKNIDWTCKILDRNNINTSQHYLKSWAAGGNTVDHDKENKQYSDQLGANKDNQMMNQINWRQCFLNKDNPWTSTFRSTEDSIVQRQSVI